LILIAGGVSSCFGDETACIRLVYFIYTMGVIRRGSTVQGCYTKVGGSVNPWEGVENSLSGRRHAKEDVFA